jgi:hypothetical protein
MAVAHRLANFARVQLEPILDLSGKILYSSVDTLKPGRVYLLGHNPGGSPLTKASQTIRLCLDALPQKVTNDYFDESWKNRPVGTSFLQLRVKWLLQQLGLNPREVAASNLIFPRSVAVAESQFAKLSEICWPVHERILDIVTPALVIVFGNSGQSPYAFMRRRFNPSSETAVPSGHGTWTCRTFRVTGRFRVVGLPHLSRYNVRAHAHIATWLNSFLAP